MASKIGAGDARARLPGLFYSTFNRKLGKTVIHAWPKKRPALSAKTMAQNAEFRAAMKLVKFATGDERVAAGIYVAGKPFLAQDALMASTFGTIYPTVQGGGNQFWSVRIMAKEVQGLLDSIGSTQGMMLVRGADEWLCLVPGTDGQVLTYDAIAHEPVWKAGGGGGGGSGAMLAVPVWTSTLNDTSAFSLKGSSFTPSINIDLYAIWAGLSVPVGQALQCQIVEQSAVAGTITVTALVASATFANVSNALTQWMRCPFASKVTLLAGHHYALTVGFPSGSGTQGLSIGSSVQFFQNAPMPGQWNLVAKMATIAPVVGTTIDTGTSSTAKFAIGTEWAVHA